jgi:hypothetical protein
MKLPTVARLLAIVPLQTFMQNLPLWRAALRYRDEAELQLRLPMLVATDK